MAQRRWHGDGDGEGDDGVVREGDDSGGAAREGDDSDGAAKAAWRGEGGVAQRRRRGDGDGGVTLGRKRCFLPNFEWHDLFLAAGHGFRADPHPLS